MLETECENYNAWFGNRCWRSESTTTPLSSVSEDKHAYYKYNYGEVKLPFYYTEGLKDKLGY